MNSGIDAQADLFLAAMRARIRFIRAINERPHSPHCGCGWGDLHHERCWCER